MDFFNYAYDHGHIQFSQYIYRIGTYHYNWHPEIEILVVLQGRVEVCHDSEYTNLGVNDIIILPPQCGHATLALEPDTMAMVLHLHPSILAQYDRVFRQSTFFVTTDEGTQNLPLYVALREQLGRLILLLAKVQEDQFDMASLNKSNNRSFNATTLIDIPNLSIEHLFLQVLETLTAILLPHTHEPQGNPVAIQQEATFEKMITYIDKHYKESITLGDIASIGGYTESYASQFFKRQLGISFKTYLLRMRLRDAAVQLVNTKQQVVDIANQCGFSDVKSFNTAFRKHFHTTPSEYRRIATKVERQTMMDNWKEYIASDDVSINQCLQLYIAPIEVDKTERISEHDLSLATVQQIKSQLEDTLKQLDMALNSNKG
ncbi:AraC family transcriptional regulator [Veillonella criceti]|uniref:DNA-binding transcriptional regulator MelR n=1 Tax=Veillonella criceti TaxID=103891 RepID=A0A380NPH5_9FIRM|nr:AraC family transcriptional regulator [Veillonella criceti]SUP44905.1 DNA-binding transcriptional regulator MelR [Veillonella criceti]